MWIALETQFQGSGVNLKRSALARYHNIRLDESMTLGEFVIEFNQTLRVLKDLKIKMPAEVVLYGFYSKVKKRFKT